MARFYYDPWRWETDGERWAVRHGQKVVFPWETNRPKVMHEALVRFVTDLTEGRIHHDGCPLSWLAMDNAQKVAARGTKDGYGIAKPSQTQKIDPAITRTIAHEAACDAVAAGWSTPEPEPIHFQFGF